MKEIENFVKKSLKRVPKHKAKKELIEGLVQGLIEKYDDLIEQGMDKEIAIEKVKEEFGSVDDIVTDFESSKSVSFIKLKARNAVFYSTIATLLIIGGSIFTNLYFTKDIIWFVYVAIGVVFWPLTMLYKYMNIRGE